LIIGRAIIYFVSLRGPRHWPWILLAVAAVLWPDPALAWGPAAHLDYGLFVLREAGLLAPALRGLLLHYSDDYLYGCVAADIVVGKNFAKTAYHCHTWHNGMRLLHAAHTDPLRSLSYGFLSHLAADTVAHNYYVPYKTVESHGSPATRHTYWELRFDQVAHGDERVWQALRRIGRRRFPEHDAFLQENLLGASRLFSFSTSRHLFNSMMLVSQANHWRRAMSLVARRSRLQLPEREVEEYNHLARGAVMDFLVRGDRSRTVTSDPIGARALRASRRLRGQLKTLRAAPRLHEREVMRLSHDIRVGFRNGIYGDLVVPDLGAHA
jgi:zinc dependent phospholipase C